MADEETENQARPVPPAPVEPPTPETAEAIAADESDHTNDPKAYFVYLYRDENRNPVYVGQAKRIDRARAHIANATNEAFRAWLAAHRRAAIEVIGPLGSKWVADAVETAVISACKPAQALQGIFVNTSPGVTKLRFVPLGVPEALAARTTQPLTREDILEVTNRRGKVLFVKIGDSDLDLGVDPHGERIGYNIFNPPPDQRIRARLREAWYLQRFLESFAQAEGGNGPVLLVGLYGKPGNSFIVGCAAINQAAWVSAQPELVDNEHMLVVVPLFRPPPDYLPGGEQLGQRDLDLPVANRTPEQHLADPWGIDEEAWRGRPLAPWLDPGDDNLKPLVKFARGRWANFKVWDGYGQMPYPNG